MLDNIERNLLILATEIRERFAAGNLDGARAAYHDWQVQVRRVPEADRDLFINQAHGVPHFNPDPDEWLREAQRNGEKAARYWMADTHVDEVTEQDLSLQIPAEGDSLEATAYAAGFLSAGRGGARPGAGRKPNAAHGLPTVTKRSVSLSPESDAYVLSQQQPGESYSATLDRILREQG